MTNMEIEPVVILFIGSPSDRPHVDEITRALDALGLMWEVHVSSAHKTPGALLALLEKHENDPRPKVYITVAGRSNALSGMVDANVVHAVIACPPLGDEFAQVDIYSSLRMPTGVAPLLVLEPANAALAAAKILALVSDQAAAGVAKLQDKQRRRVLEADAKLGN